MKRLGILPVPAGWDASPSQGYPLALWSPVPIYTPGWRETMWNKVSCLKETTRRQWPGSNHRALDRKSNALTARPPHLSGEPEDYSVCCVRFKTPAAEFVKRIYEFLKVDKRTEEAYWLIPLLRTTICRLFRLHSINRARLECLSETRWICKRNNGTEHKVCKHEHNGVWIELLQSAESYRSKNCQNLCLLPDPCRFADREFLHRNHRV